MQRAVAQGVLDCVQWHRVCWTVRLAFTSICVSLWDKEEQEGNIFHVESLGHKELWDLVLYHYSAIRNSLK